MDDRLYRSRTDRMLTGVAGGLADRLDLDPSLVRVLWVISMPLTGFITLLAYIVMAVVVPEEPDELAGPMPPGPSATPEAAAAGPGTDTAVGDTAAGQAGAGPAPDWRSQRQQWHEQRHAWRAQLRAERAQRRAQRRSGGGAVVGGLILIGLGTLFLAQELIPSFNWDVAWPIAAIVLGVVLLLGSIRRAA